MPCLDSIISQNMLVRLPNMFLDYKAAYRSFSMGIDRDLSHSLVEMNIGKNEYYIDTMANIASNCKSCNGLSVSKKRQPWIYKKRHSSKTLTRFNNKQSK